jgi:hypothetical protein
MSVHILRRYIQRSDDRVQRVVHALDDLAVVSLGALRRRLGGKLAFQGRLCQHRGIANHVVDRIDALVQVVLDVLKSPL